MTSTILSPATEAEQLYSDILPRIKALEELSQEDLGKEMSLLKKALMDNPQACSLMLPEDIGQMVTALRRITGQALASVKEKKAPKERVPKLAALSAEDLAAAFDDL